MKVIKKFLVAAVVVIVMTLTGCGERLKEGEVVDKGYQGAYTTMLMTQVGDVTVPIVEDHEETFTLKIKGTTSKGEEVIQNVVVSEAEQALVKIGDYYVVKEVK